MALFVVIVQIPTFITGHMSYVDVGWPLGLVTLAVIALCKGKQTVRMYLCSICLLLHGLRMAVGALVLFFPYKWKEDLARYQYAKKRFTDATGKPGWWWIKQQHDTLMQCFANSVIIAGPIILMSTNPKEEVHPVEIVGSAMWALFHLTESLADVQKQKFVVAAKKNGDIRTAVLGHTPYDTKEYWLWTMSRHPNYFCEWMCWNSFIVMSIPSVIDLFNDEGVDEWAQYGIIVLLFYLSRVFYDCLVYWTGAEPAESRSVSRRPQYKVHQEKVRVLFPCHVPGFDHKLDPGWPMNGEEGALMQVST